VLTILLIAAGAAWRIGLVSVPHETGYFAPIFAPDGKSLFTIRREARALVTGPGVEFFTPPATVRLQRDRFDLLNITLPDARVTVVETFPPSPLEGSSIRAYHGAIFGVPHAHLRWADPAHLEYEIAVTRHDTPLARTFVIRKVWNATTATYATTTPWRETPAVMSGDEPQQLHGDRELIAVPGDELMPCGISVLQRDTDGLTGMTVIETPMCRRKYESGAPPPSFLATLSRREAIERAETIKSTYADLVARGRQSGKGEGQAMLDAGKEMQRLGFYPKTPTMVAAAARCEASPLFTISDAELTFGLFPDIEAAIERPGREVDKSMGAYITHRDYSTSRLINEYLDAGHSILFVRARGACWQITIDRPSPAVR
jgi:hypothetical protein